MACNQILLRRIADDMSKKALYKHKRTGDLFAIETDESGNVLSTSGPLLTKELNPEELDYDNYCGALGRRRRLE